MTLTSLPESKPMLYQAILFAKRSRPAIGGLLFAACIIETAVLRETPRHIHDLSLIVMTALLLITAGVAMRVAAGGVLRKQSVLARRGAYSLCRHPLYAGTILIAIGALMLLADWHKYLAFGLYLILFYSLAIIWEEHRLRNRFHRIHAAYCRSVPLILPCGRYKAARFSWARALRQAGPSLVVALGLLATIEFMAESF